VELAGRPRARGYLCGRRWSTRTSRAGRGSEAGVGVGWQQQASRARGGRFTSFHGLEQMVDPPSGTPLMSILAQPRECDRIQGPSLVTVRADHPDGMTGLEGVRLLVRRLGTGRRKRAALTRPPGWIAREPRRPGHRDHGSPAPMSPASAARAAATGHGARSQPVDDRLAGTLVATCRAWATDPGGEAVARFDRARDDEVVGRPNPAKQRRHAPDAADRGRRALSRGRVVLSWRPATVRPGRQE